MWDKLFVYIRGLSELFINKKEKKKLQAMEWNYGNELLITQF